MCPERHFRLDEHGECEPMLNCSQISDNVAVGDYYTQGGVKRLYQCGYAHHNVRARVRLY